METEIEEKIKELSETYEMSEDKIKEYYEMITEYPFVNSVRFDMLFEALERVVQEQVTQSFESNYLRNYKGDFEYINVKDTIETILFSVYGEEAVPYLKENIVEKYSHKILN